MFELETLLVLIPGLPLLAALVTAVLGPRLLKDRAHLPVIVALVLSCACSFALIRDVKFRAASDSVGGPGFEVTHTLWNWAGIENALARPAISPPLPGKAVTIDDGHVDFNIGVTLRADALTAMMLGMVTFISSLVAIYASGYMQGDRGYWRFFSYIGLFVFSMTMLVSVSNFLLLYVFWEAVGACSYLLIGFWYEKPEAAAAGKKAFLVNRVGDFGFAIGIFLIWITYGTLNFHDADAVPGVLGQFRLAQPELIAGGILGTAICLFLFVGACGKSAQFPLHVWLPDAMEGPTPVSALIHAATMVTAGVYMVARCTPLFMAAPWAQAAVALIGGFTALLAGLIALTQTDLKRILAYSTISQLGYMFLGLGTGSLAGIIAGMFHLFTHAFFKALLFLGAGSVMHAMGNVIDIRRFSGLRVIMPRTFWTFAVGSLALAGIWPFAGFWSKDAILASVHDRVHVLETLTHGESAEHAAPEDAAAAVKDPWAILPEAQLARFLRLFQLLYYGAVFTAFLTAFYTFRAFFLTFYGPCKVPEEAGHHAHESPPKMTIPLVVLAVGAFCVGFLSIWGDSFARFLEHTPSLSYATLENTMRPGEFHWDIAVVSTVVAALGVAVAAYFYLRHQTEAKFLAKWLKPAYAFSRNKFYIDELYWLVFVWPLEIVALVAYWVDRYIVDGVVDLVGSLPKAASRVLRPLQTGLTQFYALAMVLGLLILAGTLLMG